MKLSYTKGFFLVGLQASYSLLCTAFSPLPHVQQLASRRATGSPGKHSHVAIKITSLSSSTNQNGGEEKTKELTPDTVAEMIEVSFVNACLQLAQG